MGLGLVFAVLVGLSWVVTGAAVGLAEKHGYGAWRHQFAYTSMYGLATALVVAVGAARCPNVPAFSLRFDPAPALFIALWGVLSYAQNLCVGAGMRRGPNGIVWTIAQSGFALPVLLGFAMGNTPLTAIRVAGVFSVLLGVVCCGRAKGNGKARHGRGWLVPALLGFLFCGLNQCAQAMASFFPAETRPSPLLRVLFGAVGVLSAVAVHRAAVLAFGNVRSRERQPPPSRYGRLVTICAVNAAVFFLSGFCFHYNALDRLEAAGRISAANPVMLAACLVGFVLYGIVFLREKPSASQLAGTLLAVIGAILVAI